jgi:AcrR family transcriptional regulator
LLIEYCEDWCDENAIVTQRLRRRVSLTESPSPPSTLPEERRPRGRAEVVESLLDAASSLFAERGPEAVSVRDIAARARVNHALLHRHFESKERLIEAVLQRHAAAFREVVAVSTSPREAAEALFVHLRKEPGFLRMIAYLILQGAPPETLVVPDGGLKALLSVTARDQPVGEDARADTLMSAALALGWALFEPFLVQASGNAPPADLMEKRLRRAQRLILFGKDNAS